MNLVDSSAWLEFFADEPNAEFFAEAIERSDVLLVPSICIFEVFKRVLIQRGEHEALQAVAHMQQGQVVELSATLVMNAAMLSHQLKLAMADSIILATARAYEATVWTQDDDFAGIEGVKYRSKQKRS